MRNLKLTIEYDGTNYCGWQTQKINPPSPRLRRVVRRNFSEGGQNPKVKTIQQTLEKTLQKILQEKVKLVASGRTDAGVHALSQVANFKTNSNIPLKNLQKALNSLLPSDIVIKRIEIVPLDFHSRFHAKSKLYRYTILNRNHPSALERNFVYFLPQALKVKVMQKQAKFLLGKHNLRSFQAADTIKRNPIRNIKKVKVSKSGDFIHIDIQANGFLYNMARNIVGTLLEIGKGKSLDIKQLLKAKDRSLSGPTAPAKGLCLVEVKY